MQLLLSRQLLLSTFAWFHADLYSLGYPFLLCMAVCCGSGDCPHLSSPVAPL